MLVVLHPIPKRTTGNGGCCPVRVQLQTGFLLMVMTMQYIVACFVLFPVILAASLFEPTLKTGLPRRQTWHRVRWASSSTLRGLWRRCMTRSIWSFSHMKSCWWMMTMRMWLLQLEFGHQAFEVEDEVTLESIDHYVQILEVKKREDIVPTWNLDSADMVCIMPKRAWWALVLLAVWATATCVIHRHCSLVSLSDMLQNTYHLSLWRWQ